PQAVWSLRETQRVSTRIFGFDGYRFAPPILRGFSGRGRQQSPNLRIPLTPWKPPWAPMGNFLLRPGTLHAFPRRTQPAVGLVVDRRPSDVVRDHGADAERG